MRHDEWPALDELPRLPEYPIAVRWTDMDVLDHVNNVQYIEFTDNARRALEGLVDGVAAATVPECRIDFLTALESRSDPASVVSAVADGVLYQEVRTVQEGASVTHARVRTRLTGSSTIPRLDGPGHRYEHRTRATDAHDGVLSCAALFEIFQEARIRAVDRGTTLPHERIVVARNVVRSAAPIIPRDEPFVVHTRLRRLGTASLELVLQLMDADEVVVESEAVIVGFDLRSGRSRPFSESERAALLSALPLPQPVVA